MARKYPTYWIGNFFPYSIPFLFVWVSVFAFQWRKSKHSSVNLIHLRELYITVRFVWLDVWCGTKYFCSIPLPSIQTVETQQSKKPIFWIILLFCSFSSCTFSHCLKLPTHFVYAVATAALASLATWITGKLSPRLTLTTSHSDCYH